MKLVVRVRLLPTPGQAAALEATLTACNGAATWAASVAFEEGARKNLALRKLAYQDIKTRWGLGAQAAQHVIKKACDAYTTLRANLRAGRYGRPGSKRHSRASGKPVAFRPAAAQPCRSCGFVEHADHNSSHNIAHRGWMVWVCGAQSTAPGLTLTA